MKSEITYSELRAKIENGKLELQSDLYGSSMKFADVRKTKTGERHTFRVTGEPTAEETKLFFPTF